jgi:hypothetical protein
MSIDNYLKGKLTTPCPISSTATGNMVVRGLYKSPVVAWREAVSNACDAMRYSDEKIVKVYTNVNGDGVIEDWGTGIEDHEHFQRFIGIGRTRENINPDVKARDDKEIGRFGVGKNSYLGLSKIKVVQFFSHANKAGKKSGTIVTLIQEPKGEIKYVNPPEYMDSTDVLPHRGMKVVICQLIKPMNTHKLIEYLSKRFALKIARGYKIYVDDILVKKPESFDSKHQPVLFSLDNGIEVYGNLKHVDKPRNENIDILVNQVYIESVDFEWKVEGWVNCDELELTTSRDGISTDENTVYPEFMNKLKDHLSKHYDPRDTQQLESTNEKEWQKIASQAIMQYFKTYKDETCSKFLQGIVRNKLGLKGTAVKGGEIWKTLENSKLDKVLNSEGGGDIEVKRKNQKRGKKGKKGKNENKVTKSIGNGGKNSDTKYALISGQGWVKVKNEVEDDENEEEIVPQIPFKKVPSSKEKPLVYFDENESAFILNTSREGVKMFSNPKSDGARNEILRAIIKATPENQYISIEDLDKKYYNLVDIMSE